MSSGYVTKFGYRRVVVPGTRRLRAATPSTGAGETGTREGAAMIYLASPYSHPDAAVRQERFEATCRVAAELIRRGHMVFSPIAHSHCIAQHGLPVDWGYWERHDRRLLAACDELWVLKLDGWQQSRGVQAEIAIAPALGKPVRDVSPEDIARLAHVGPEAGR